jgi:hypothetical protein
MSDECEYYDYNNMWIESDNCITKKYVAMIEKSVSVIDTSISNEPDLIYDEWKTIWIN